MIWRAVGGEAARLQAAFAADMRAAIGGEATPAGGAAAGAKARSGGSADLSAHPHAHSRRGSIRHDLTLEALQHPEEADEDGDGVVSTREMEDFLHRKGEELHDDALRHVGFYETKRLVRDERREDADKIAHPSIGEPPAEEAAMRAMEAKVEAVKTERAKQALVQEERQRRPQAAAAAGKAAAESAAEEGARLEAGKPAGLAGIDAAGADAAGTDAAGADTAGAAAAGFAAAAAKAAKTRQAEEAHSGYIRAARISSIDAQHEKLEARRKEAVLCNAENGSCFQCGSKFGWVVRRHHCRLCAGQVCGACSRSSVAFPGSDATSHRVCDWCLHHVEAAEAQRNGP